MLKIGRAEHDPESGTVSWFNSQKGFGFIKPDGGGEDIVVHQTSIRSCWIFGLNKDMKTSINRPKSNQEDIGHLSPLSDLAIINVPDGLVFFYCFRLFNSFFSCSPMVYSSQRSSVKIDRSDGFRVLNEDNMVECAVEEGKDGRTKAVKFTGPNGAVIASWGERSFSGGRGRGDGDF
ncbi:uncharacterized protein LOC144712000 [Wolffia australiana]